MTIKPLGLLIVVGGCIGLGALIPMMLQPYIGWNRAFSYAGWCSVVVLVVEIGTHV